MIECVGLKHWILTNICIQIVCKSKYNLLWFKGFGNFIKFDAIKILCILLPNSQKINTLKITHNSKEIWWKNITRTQHNTHNFVYSAPSKQKHPPPPRRSMCNLLSFVWGRRRAITDYLRSNLPSMETPVATAGSASQCRSRTFVAACHEFSTPIDGVASDTRSVVLLALPISNTPYCERGSLSVSRGFFWSSEHNLTLSHFLSFF